MRRLWIGFLAAASAACFWMLAKTGTDAATEHARAAACASGLAETMVVGRSSDTSSAWVGPERATRRGALPALAISSPMTSVRVMSVSASMPLATSTMSWSFAAKGAAARAVERT